MRWRPKYKSILISESVQQDLTGKAEGVSLPRGFAEKGWCVEFYPSELGTHEEATFPDQQQNPTQRNSITSQ
jgi:hypothetical protein